MNNRASPSPIAWEGFGMTGTDDLSGLSEMQLVQAYIETVQSLAAIEHVGAYNRQFDRRFKIVDELKARTAALQPLPPPAGPSRCGGARRGAARPRSA